MQKIVLKKCYKSKIKFNRYKSITVMDTGSDNEKTTKK